MPTTSPRTRHPKSTNPLIACWQLGRGYSVLHVPTGMELANCRTKGCARALLGAVTDATPSATWQELRTKAFAAKAEFARGVA